MIKNRTCWLLGAAGYLTGCSGPAADAAVRGEWSLVSELRIGSVDDSRYAFGPIIDVTVGPRGNVYVTQWQEPTVAVYDHRGEFVGRFGRQGSGPGEFLSAGRLGWRADTLWVGDLAAKIHLYQPDGRFVRSIHFVTPDPGGEGVLRPSALLMDGSVLAEPRISDYAVLVQGLSRVWLSRVSPEGVILGQLGSRDIRRLWHEIRYREEGGQHAINPFSGTTLWTLRPHGDGVWLVDPEPPGTVGAYRLVSVSLAGDTVLDVSHEYSPVAITDDLVEHLASSRYSESEHLHGQIPYSRYRDAFVAGLERPQTHPPVTGVLAGLDGSLWVRREDVGADSIRWDVLDERGQHAAIVRVPTNVSLKVVAGDYAWGVQPGDLDVPYLVRYRIERG